MTRTGAKLRTRLVIGIAAITLGFAVGGIGGSAKADSTSTETSSQANFVNYGTNTADPSSGLTWAGYFEDATDSNDVSLTAQNIDSGYYNERSAVNVKSGSTNLNYVITVNNPTGVDLEGKLFTSVYDQDSADKYSGAKLRFGSTASDGTRTLKTIDNYYTASDNVSDVSASYGLTTSDGLDYWVPYDTVTSSDNIDNIVRLGLFFTLKAGKSVTFKIPVTASAGSADNEIDADKVATAPVSDFTIVFGAMYNYTTDGAPYTVTGNKNHNLLVAYYNMTAITTKEDSATAQVGDSVDAATYGADPSDAKITKVTDASGNSVAASTLNDGVFTPTAAGTYTIELTRDGYSPKTVTLTVTAPASNNSGSSSSSSTTTSSSSSSSTDVTTTTSPDTVVSGQTVANKGRAIYAVKGLYMYNKSTFTKSARKYHYTKQARTNRPIFIVDGYTKSKNGALRYKVHDYYHKSRKGYITAKSGYTKLAYYFSVPKSKAVRVITSTGVNSYAKSDLSGKKLKHYKKGTVLKVKKVVKYKLASRFELTNGRYISGNKRFVIMK
ncbi:hypothetical protein FC82_GL001951 [Secundilactobacillus collinoides DSM 20515 = JCM 1123]|uniref:DUF5776 domain-containing protein n=2 Tax=Secundilactobacillus collinoides TaxID=33960 RepID=A0A0R2BJF9_SECCO|nr:hypothetical protein FC82_GL001951 [Secundilactobacillus collinoides DSM 20515 = JCM 1123]